MAEAEWRFMRDRFGFIEDAFEWTEKPRGRGLFVPDGRWSTFCLLKCLLLPSTPLFKDLCFHIYSPATLTIMLSSVIKSVAHLQNDKVQFSKG